MPFITARHAAIMTSLRSPEVTNIEPGFYFGAAFVSYVLNVLWIGLAFPLIWISMEHTEFNIIVSIVVMIVVLVPYTFQLSRSIWLAVFVKYRGH